MTVDVLSMSVVLTDPVICLCFSAGTVMHRGFLVQFARYSRREAQHR